MDLKLVNLINADPGLPKGKMYATSQTGGSPFELPSEIGGAME